MAFGSRDNGPSADDEISVRLPGQGSSTRVGPVTFVRSANLSYDLALFPVPTFAEYFCVTVSHPEKPTVQLLVVGDKVNKGSCV